MILTLSLALATEGPEPLPKDPKKLVWSGVVLPLFGANTQDGAGVGLGGEVFARRREREEGYRVKITASLWVTTNLGYTSDFVQMDYRGKTEWLGRAGFRGWTNHAFVGVGGDRVQLDQTDDELGNRVYGPFAFLGWSRELGSATRWFGQASYKTFIVDAAEGGALDRLAPDGYRGGSYVDGTLGLEYNTTDRWPMPDNGVRAEVSGRVGISGLRDQGTGLLAGGNAEVIAWKSLGKHLVFGARLVVDKTVGRRPFFETDSAGGRWRDELGSEQAFSGYGRTRTRGDGLVAGMVELRPYFFRTNHSFLDFEFHGSVFAEQGWLTNKGSFGPPLPTIGIGPQILFQGAIQCRPFMAWGWRSAGPDDRRRPVGQFGISFLDPL